MVCQHWFCNNTHKPTKKYTQTRTKVLNIEQRNHAKRNWWIQILQSRFMHYPDSKTIVVLNLHQQQQQHVKSVSIALNLSKSALTSTISLLPISNFDKSVTKAMQNVTLSRLSSLTYLISQITFAQWRCRKNEGQQVITWIKFRDALLQIWGEHWWIDPSFSCSVFPLCSLHRSVKKSLHQKQWISAKLLITHMDCMRF